MTIWFVRIFLCVALVMGISAPDASAALFDDIPHTSIDSGEGLAAAAGEESSPLDMRLQEPVPTEPFAPEPDALPGASETATLSRLAGFTQLLASAERGDARAQWIVGLIYFRGVDRSRDPVKGLEWLHKSAAQGDTTAYQLLGEIYGAGNGVKADPAQAIQWYEKALPAEMPITLYLLGTHYATGYGVPVDRQQARTYFDLAYKRGMPDGLCATTALDLAEHPDDPAVRAAAFDGYVKAAEEGSFRCLMWVADAYDRGTLIGDDQAKATEWYERAARTGAAPGLHVAGIRRIQGKGQAPDPMGGIAMLQQAVAAGYVPSILAMGHSFLKGVVVPRDETRGVAIFREMADLGVPRAMLLLGLVYREQQDWGRAEEWLAKAAENGDALGYHYIAGLYRFGQGRPANPVKAMEYYRRGADAGVPQAMAGMAALFRLGVNGQKDYAKSLEYATKAAQAGDPYGQWNLYVLYSQGLGVARDDARAEMWLRRCAGQQYMDCVRMLGVGLTEGMGMPGDVPAGIRYLKQAADMGDPAASWMIAARSYNGQGTPANLDDAIFYGEMSAPAEKRKRDRLLTAAYFEKQISVLCGKGGAPLMTEAELASDPRYAKLNEAVPDTSYRASHARLAVTETWVEGLRRCGAYGERLCAPMACYPDKTAPRRTGPDIDAHLADLRRKAEGGSGFAQLTLGTTYLLGLHGVFDPKQAFVLIQKAAESGVPEAQAILGGAYYSGGNVPKDREKARYWYSLAAKGEHVPVLPNLAYMEMVGEGGPKDTASAVARFRQAADKHIVKALYWMGRLHEAGSLLPLDPVKARNYYEQSQGWENTPLRLGFMLYQGIGGPRTKPGRGSCSRRPPSRATASRRSSTLPRWTTRALPAPSTRTRPSSGSSMRRPRAMRPPSWSPAAST
jgi:TPR repeat protein